MSVHMYILLVLVLAVLPHWLLGPVLPPINQ